MAIEVGLRVVRGPDWCWGNQDGGEGHVGTVAELVEASGEDRSVIVQWDCGNRCRYRCGHGKKYDLRVLDNAPTGVKHSNITCDGCMVDGVIGLRWKCAKCDDFDLCTVCYMDGKHPQEHEFIRFDAACQKTRVFARSESQKKVEIKGLYSGAEVVKGYDWSGGDEDGGGGGKVVTVLDWDRKCYRAAVEVEWAKTGQRKKYKVGHNGKVEVMYTTPASKGHCYSDHLPILGAPHVPPADDWFASGDCVKVELDIDILAAMQEDHGGWNLEMIGIIGEFGIVNCIHDEGDLIVEYGSKKYRLNPSAVVKAEFQFSPGQVVRIMDDMAEVMKLQLGHGEWNEDMAASVGKLGVVKGTNGQGNVIVIVKGQVWLFNPACLVSSPDEKITCKEVLENDESSFHQQSLQALADQENSEVLVKAAVVGETDIIRKYLEKFPNEVNAKSNGKTALTVAAATGKVEVIRVLMEYQASVDEADEVGQQPIHFAAVRNQPEVAKVLLDAGADPNAVMGIGATPLTVAANKGNSQVLEVLVKHPKTNISAQDSDGDTALHCAVYVKSCNCVKLLLEAGADPTLINFKLNTALHLACQIGYVEVVKLLLTFFPKYLNLPNDEQKATPLHMAAFNNRPEVVAFLAKQESCKLDAQTDDKHTPLHAAIMKGYSHIFECLVGHGAGLNVQDMDGDTPLHLLLKKDSVNDPSDETPELKKVQQAISELVGDSTVDSRAVVACFFIREGADISIKNDEGETALEACSADIAATLIQFAEQHKSSGAFRGSLRCRNTNEQDSQLSRQSERTQDQNHPLNSTEADVNASHVEPAVTTDGRKLCQGPPQASDPSTTGKPLQNTTAEEELCLVCESPITVKLVPCGHTVICELCACRAKKCPHCKNPVTNFTKLNGNTA